MIPELAAILAAVFTWAALHIAWTAYRGNSARCGAGMPQLFVAEVLLLAAVAILFLVASGKVA